MSIVSLVIWILGIWGCYKVAKKNHRNTTLAIIMGILFSLLALIGYLIIGKK